MQLGKKSKAVENHRDIPIAPLPELALVKPVTSKLVKEGDDWAEQKITPARTEAANLTRNAKETDEATGIICEA